MIKLKTSQGVYTLEIELTELEGEFREVGYGWIVQQKAKGLDNESILNELFARCEKDTKSDENKSLKDAWLRGAYDALIGLGIISYLGKSEAAKQTGYTRNAIQKAIENGYLKATLVDGHYNIHPLDLEAWQNSDKKRKPYKKIEKP